MAHEGVCIFLVTSLIRNYGILEFIKGKGKGIRLESRLHDNACSAGFTFPLTGWAPMQPATIDPTLDLCTRYHYGWVDRGSVEYEVFPTLLHMASTRNRTKDLLILSPVSYTPIPYAEASRDYVCNAVVCRQGAMRWRLLYTGPHAPIKFPITWDDLCAVSPLAEGMQTSLTIILFIKTNKMFSNKRKPNHTSTLTIFIHIVT